MASDPSNPRYSDGPPPTVHRHGVLYRPPSTVDRLPQSDSPYPLRILLLGKFGQLGWELLRTLATLGQVRALDYPEIDLTNPQNLPDHLLGDKTFIPQVIINATAYTAVDRAESEAEVAMAINAKSPGILAEIARSLGAAFIHYSTDYVFNGKKGSPYLETDPPDPLGVYGKSKLEGEEAIRQIGGAYLILRTSWVYSLRRDSFVTKVLSWGRQNQTLRIVDDQIGNPTWARMLAEITAQLLACSLSAPSTPNQSTGWFTERAGTYHLAGSGYASRLEWARTILKYDPHPSEQLTQELLPARTADFPTSAQRPLFSALNCDLFTTTFGLRLPDWEAALQLAMETS